MRVEVVRRRFENDPCSLDVRCSVARKSITDVRATSLEEGPVAVADHDRITMGGSAASSPMSSGRTCSRAVRWASIKALRAVLPYVDAPSCSHPVIFFASGRPPACTSLPSITSPGVLMTP